MEALTEGMPLCTRWPPPQSTLGLTASRSDRPSRHVEAFSVYLLQAHGPHVSLCLRHPSRNAAEEGREKAVRKQSVFCFWSQCWLLKRRHLNVHETWQLLKRRRKKKRFSLHRRYQTIPTLTACRSTTSFFMFCLSGIKLSMCSYWLWKNALIRCLWCLYSAET